MSNGADPAYPDSPSLDGSSLARRFVGGAAWSVAGAVVSGGVAVLTAMLVARTLGKAVYGQLVVIQSTLGMVGVFAGFGIAATATRYVSELKQRDTRRLGDILTLAERVVLAFGLVGTIGLAAAAGWTATHALNEETLRVPLVMAAGSVFFAAVDGYQKGVLIGFESTRAYAIGLVAGAMAGLPVMLLATSYFGLQGGAAAIALNALIQAGISRYQMLRVFRQLGVRLNARGSLQEMPVLWKFALPALLGGIVVAPSHWVAQAMLANSPHGYAELAVLGIAMQWFGAIMFVPVAVGRIVLPMLTAHVTQDDRRSPRRILFYAVGGNALAALPLAAIVCLLGPFILRLYGTSFAADVTPLVIAVATAALVAIQTPVGYLLAAASRMWLGALMNAVWSIVYLGLAYLLLEQGATGILVALAAAYVIQTAWTGWYALNTARHE